MNDPALIRRLCSRRNGGTPTLGVSFTNLNVRAGDRDAAIAGLRRIGGLPAYVTRPAEGWISVYPRETERKEPARLQGAVTLLSAALAAPVVGLLVRDSDLFCYVFADGGRVLDRYASRTASPEPPVGGDPQAILRVCKPGMTLDDLRAVLDLRMVGRRARSPEERERTEKEMALQKERLAARYPEICRELAAMGLPVPPLEQVLAQLNTVEDRLTGQSGEAAAAEEQAGAFAALLGIPGRRALRGWKLIREDEPAPGVLATPVTE
ncbi:MAG: hypothetical protein HYY17_12050 [Planctomycetes bacterium]|nr:hypothetical protein [Planctomycetota bacterium]